MQSEEINRGCTEMPHEVDNSGKGLEKRIDTVVMQLARIIGRRIAQDQFEAEIKANSDSDTSQGDNNGEQ